MGLPVRVRLPDGSGFAELKYLLEDRDRHGKVRIYFRKRGRRKIALKHPPGSPEFMAEYQAAIAGDTLPADPSKPALASLRWLCMAYMGSPEFMGMDPRTRRVRKLILDGLCQEPISAEIATPIGSLPFADMPAAKVRTLRDRKSATPEAANSRVKALRQVFAWACDAGHASGNPAREVPYLKSGGTGHREWTIEEVQRFEARHLIGSKARLALSLLLYTMQRRADVVAFGRQHVRDGWLSFTQNKNRVRKPVALSIPIHAELARIIAASPCGDLTFLVSDRGTPFTAESFGNWFRERCREAQVPGRAHGLRKAGMARLAELGATDREIMALSGHRTSKEVDRYTRSASQKHLAASAMAKLEGRSENKVTNLSPRKVPNRKTNAD